MYKKNRSRGFTDFPRYHVLELLGYLLNHPGLSGNIAQYCQLSNNNNNSTQDKKWTGGLPEIYFLKVKISRESVSRWG